MVSVFWDVLPRCVTRKLSRTFFLEIRQLIIRQIVIDTVKISFSKDPPHLLIIILPTEYIRVHL